MNIQNNTGAKIDTRPAKEQAKNYSYREHIGFSPTPTYLTKTKALKAIKYDMRNQMTSLTCGAHAGELLMSIENGGKRFEEAFIYNYRINKPDGGMYHYDIGNILKLRGIPSDCGISGGESVYNAYKPTQAQIDEAKKLAGKDYIILDDNKYTIDDLAYIVNDLKLPIIIFVYWTGEEWSTTYPVANSKLSIGANGNKHHYVTVLPESAYKENGESYVIIQDSAHFGDFDIRHLNANWIKERTYTGLYRLNLVKEKSLVSFAYNFTKDLKVGSKGKEVEKLQKALEELGFFPKGLPYGYFGGITRQAVKDFQKAYFSTILQVLGLKTPTGNFYSSTRKQLNKLMLK